MAKTNDYKWMHLALDLAEKGRISTSPNPMVGACVVCRNILVGKGYHRVYGGDHAEIMALRDAGKRARGAELYVTLEPCVSWGKTPPCVDSIVRSKIREVIIGTRDPNPQNYGKGIRSLRKAGIRVRSGILAREVREQNKFFFKYAVKRLPWVTLKMAQSADGKIATAEGRSRWISSAKSRRFVHRLRAEQDAILVGRNTAIQDNPLLSSRWGYRHRLPEKPWRVVLDPEFEVSPRSRIFRGKQLTILAVHERNLKSRQKKRCRGGGIVLPVGGEHDQLDLRKLLRKLASLGVVKLLVEGGGEVAWSMLEAGLVDQVFFIIAPKIIGGRNAITSVEGEGVRTLSKVFRLRDSKVTRLGQDWLWEARI